GERGDQLVFRSVQSQADLDQYGSARARRAGAADRDTNVCSRGLTLQGISKSSRCRKDRSMTLIPNAFLRSSVASVGPKLKRTSVSLPLFALVTPSRSRR